MLDETRAAAPRLNSQLLKILEHAASRGACAADGHDGHEGHARFKQQIVRWAEQEAEAVQRLGAPNVSLEQQLAESVRRGGTRGAAAGHAERRGMGTPSMGQMLQASYEPSHLFCLLYLPPKYPLVCLPARLPAYLPTHPLSV